MVAEGNHLRLDLSDEDEKEFCSDEDTAPGSACCDSTTSCDSEEIVRAAPWKSGETTVLPLAAISSQGFAERAEPLVTNLTAAEQLCSASGMVGCSVSGFHFTMRGIVRLFIMNEE